MDTIPVTREPFDTEFPCFGNTKRGLEWENRRERYTWRAETGEKLKLKQIYGSRVTGGHAISLYLSKVKQKQRYKWKSFRNAGRV